MGTNPNALKNGVCPECRRKWTTHPGSPDHPEQSSVVAQVEEEPIDKEAWDRVIVELKEMEKRYNLDPNRSIPRNDYSHYLPPDDFDLTPYLHEADAFRAKIALQAERRARSGPRSKSAGARSSHRSTRPIRKATMNHRIHRMSADVETLTDTRRHRPCKRPSPATTDYLMSLPQDLHARTPSTIAYKRRPS